MKSRLVRWLRSVQVEPVEQSGTQLGGLDTASLPDRLRARRDALVEEARVSPRGTRPRVVVISGLGVVVLTSMLQAVSMNVLAVNFTTANSRFQMYTNYLQGEQVAAYLNRTSRQDVAPVPVAEMGVKKASLAGMCLISNESIPGIGDYSLMMTAGDPVAGTPGFQSGVAVTNPNYYLPTGWVAGTDVWGPNGNAAAGEYPGALKGARATNAITATDLFLNASAINGAGYKLNGMYLGERAQDVGPNAGVTWETGEGAPSPAGATAGGFGLRVDHLNLAGARLYTEGSPFIPGTPAVPEIPGQPGYNVTVSDGPPAITDLTVNAPGAGYANVASDNGWKNQVGRITDGDLQTKWVVSNNNGSTVSKTATFTYTLSQPWKVGSYQVGAGDIANTQPKTWTLQASTDNSSWTTIDTVTNADIQPTSWKQFYVGSPGYYKYYRLAVTANEGAAGLQMSEWKLNGIGVVDSASANPAQDATYVRNNGENYRMLIDGNGGTKFYNHYGDAPSGTGVAYMNPNFRVMYELNEPAKVDSYTLRSAADSNTFRNRNPRNWKVYGSNATDPDINSDTGWTLLDTRTVTDGQNDAGFVGHNSAVQRTIASPGAYRYYRLVVDRIRSPYATAWIIGSTENADASTGAGNPTRRFRLQLADWMLNTGTVQEWVPPTETIPGVPAGPDTPAIPAGGSAYGLRLAGSIKLPKLKIRVLPGAKTQADCPGAAS